MFIRWQSRKRAIYYSYWGRKEDPHSDVHWNAVLVESVRVNGKPRQKHIANLCGFTEHQIKSPHQQIYVWEHAIKTFDRLDNRITPEQRRQVEAALAKRIGRPKPTKREIAAQHKAAAAARKATADALKALLKGKTP
jgi:hypothetical protein